MHAHFNLCPAENEARAFAKSEGWETEDVEEIALRVRAGWLLIP